MERITLAKLKKTMRDYNKGNPQDMDSPKLFGVIVYRSENWDKAYSETARSYRVSNANRCFQDGKISNALFGDCLDGTDIGVRLDWYNWAVDYCYMEV